MGAEEARHGRVFFSHSRSLWLLAHDARDRAWKAVESEPYALTADTTVCIAMSTAAAEGFINELAEISSFDQETTEFLHAYGVLSRFLIELERSHATVQAKYNFATIILTGNAVDLGGSPYQDFSSLIDLRNLHLHLKQGDKVGDKGKVEHRSKIVSDLIRKGLTYDAGDANMSWMNLLQTPKVADWALRSSLAVIKEVSNLALAKHPANLPVEATGLGLFLVSWMSTVFPRTA
ncbi:hypothetical protein [Frankia sp. CiP3]|uniref:hypothetical protein n=1 Tax=Frankia sp. CiP3 TaxID=2880971 RepID=UPI001EF5683E|nr:hypothetical protein [Frankia sp. CiP3]